MASLKQKSITGMIWTVSERLGLQAVGLLISIILARLLEPSQFGLISMLAIFTAVAQSILDSGFGSALIQKKDADQTDASSIFFFNLILGVVLAGILSLAAPLIGEFFDQPTLVPITRFLSLTLIINAFSLVQTSLLTKAMDFKAQMKVSLLATIASGVIGIVMAYQGFGVWALVTQKISRSFFQAILLWVFNTWRPSFILSLTSLKTMFSFGSRLLASGLLDSIFRHLYQAFIGRVFSATSLGYYSKALSFESAATQATSGALSKVLYPALSSVQDDDQTLKKAYRKTIRLSLFIHFPLMIGLLAIADPLFRFLLTDKWSASIPYFQILCIIGLFYPLHVLNLNILKVKGRSDLFFRLEIIKKVIVIVAIAVTYRWGVMGLLYGRIATSLIGYFLNSYYSGHLIDYSQWDQIKDLMPSFVTALVMGAIMYLVGLIPTESLILKIIIQTITGISFYYLLSFRASASELKEVRSIVTGVAQNILKNLKAVLWQTR